MSFGTVTVGRLVLTEYPTGVAESLNAATGERTLSLSGQESSPPLTPADLAALQDDLLGLRDSLVPVIFTDKADRNGYYVVNDAGAELTNWQGEAIACDWKLSLSRVGSDSEVDIESRLGGALTRANNFAVSGERWQAPPPASYAYWTGPTQPSVVSRTGEFGTIKVYRGIPVSTNPRYGCAVSAYALGRVRFLDANDRERSGTFLKVDPTDWTMTNGLVRVRPLSSSGVLEIAAYTGSWAAKGWDLRLASASLGVPSAVNVLRNDFECVVIRLTWSQTVGRTEADLTLRRGSRFVEVYLKTQFAATLRIIGSVSEGATAATGYIRASANDAAGNRYILGSAKTFQSNVTDGAIFNNSVTSLDAFVGVIAAGSSAVAGDQGDDLRAQYLGAPAETVRGVRR